MTPPRNPFAALPPAQPATRLTVVIPARNEAARIVRSLGALSAQRGTHGGRLPDGLFDVIVFANNCEDDTAARARDVARRSSGLRIHVIEDRFPVSLAHVGSARRAAMDAAAARFAGRAHDAVIATTDADTTVGPAWVAWTLHEMLATSADAVLGRIMVDPLEWRALPAASRRMLQDEDAYLLAVAQLESQFDPERYGPWPRHWQRFGSSFAVRAATYVAVGGLPPVPALEDVALYDVLAAAGARLRHSERVRVWTSARTSACVPGGFGARLAEWNQRGPERRLFVEHPESTLDRLRHGIGVLHEQRPLVAATEATAALRYAIGANAARATRSREASIAG